MLRLSLEPQCACIKPSDKEQDLVKSLSQRLFEHGVDILGPGNDVLVDPRRREDIAVAPSEQGNLQQDSEEVWGKPHGRSDLSGHLQPVRLVLSHI